MERKSRMGFWQMALVLLIASAAAGYLALERFRVEERNRAVEVVLDYNEAAAFASASGMGVTEWLKKLPFPCSIALTEETLDDWGQAILAPGGLRYLLLPDHYRQAKSMLAMKARVELAMPPAATSFVTVQAMTDAPQPMIFYVLGDPNFIRNLGLGLNPLATRQVLDAGMRPVARLQNFLGAKPDSIRFSLQAAHKKGARLVIFAGDQALGFRKELESTAEAMRSMGMLYGAVEFGKMAGDTTLTQKSVERLVRVHSVSAPEVTMTAPEELLERFARAAQERNIRVLYVRLPMSASQPPDENALEFLKQLQRSLLRDGLEIKAARPFEPLNPPVWLFMLAGAGAGALLGWGAILLKPERAWVLLPLLGAIVLGALCYTELGRKVAALTAAVAFPTIAFLQLREPPAFSWGVLARALLSVFAWSVLGALLVVGLLAESRFLVKADQFAGIKLAHVLPMLLVGMVFAYRVYGAENIRALLSQPVFWRQAAVALVLMGAVGFMLIRSGNEAPTAVPGWELKLRSLLERALSVRPRTKEFLIGYPALVVALGLYFSQRRAYLPLWMMIAAIGQVSLINTFCHLHSPLLVSATRAGWSILIGLVLGGIALWAISRWIPQEKKNQV